MIDASSGIEQQFTDVFRISCMKCGVLRRVKSMCELEQDGEQPFAVGIELVSIHDQHVEDMGFALFRLFPF